MPKITSNEQGSLITSNEQGSLSILFSDVYLRTKDYYATLNYTKDYLSDLTYLFVT